MNQIQKTLQIGIVSVIVFLISFVTVTAQNTKPLSKIYLQTGAGGGSYQSSYGNLGVQVVFKNKWSTTLSYHSISMSPKNKPSDYQAETGYFLFLPYTNEIDVKMNIISLTAGRNFNLGKKIWATLEAGPSFVSGEKASFQRTTSTSYNLLIMAGSSSNYNATLEKKSTMGAMLRADINWAFASFMGLGAGLFANFNSIQSPVGFEVKLIVGKMGREKKS